MSEVNVPSSQPPVVTTERNQRDRLWIITGVIFGAFLAALDTTILATAMPTIVGELGGMSLYSWAFSVYMILTAVSSPLWGKISDTIGKRPAFFASVSIFLFGSVLCGLSGNMVHLIVFRGVQGLGAGGLASVPFALISTVFPMQERGKALGVLSSVWGISSVIGPLIGSFIVVHLNWHWVFYVNIPGGITAILILASHYHEERVHHKESMDYAGAALLCVAIVSLLLSSLWTKSGSSVLTVPVLGSLAACALCTGLFIMRERRAAHPLLELHFFTRRAFWVGNLLGFMASFSVFGVIAYTPLFAHSVLRGSAFQAGVVVTSMSLSWSVTSAISGRIVYVLGEKVLVTAGMITMLAGFVLIMLTSADSSATYLTLCVFVIGCGMGTMTPALLLGVQHSLEPKHIGVATSTQMLARTIGGAIGVSVTGSAVTGSMLSQFVDLGRRGLLNAFPEEAKLHIGQPQELLGTHIGSLLSDHDLTLVVSAFTTSLHDGLRVGLFMALLGVIFSLLLPPAVLHTMKKPT